MAWSRPPYRRVEPFLFVNPPDDPEFSAAARAAVHAGAGAPQDLQAVLRERYPATVVRQRDLSGEPFAAWYVYREGRWTRAREAGARAGPR